MTRGKGNLSPNSYHVRRPLTRDDENSLSAGSYHGVWNDTITSVTRATSIMNMLTGTEDDDSSHDSNSVASEPMSPGWFGSPRLSLRRPSVAGSDPSSFGANFDKLLASTGEEKNDLDAPLSPTSAALKRLTLEVYQV